MIFVPQISTPQGQRRGVVLLVVIALLTLFAAVGLSFVFYAEAESASSQYSREGANLTQADLDPELLLGYFLGQLIYDVDDTNGVYSAIRGHSFGRTMYGFNYTYQNNIYYISPSGAPFNGIGRFHYSEPKLTTVANTGDNYNYINYTYYPTDNFIRDPERSGWRTSNTAAQTNTYVAGNASYTYPDSNNMFLGAINANGQVLAQSFYRPWLYNTADVTNKKYLSLQPDPTWNPNFTTPDADAGGHVRNLDNSQGTVAGANNDSVWVDLGFPVMIAPNGKKFKPLFATFITDLDNRINLNVHGNIRGLTNSHVSNQGFGPWEVNISKALTQADWVNIFVGNTGLFTGLYGRYGKDGAPATAGSSGTVYSAPWIYGQFDFDAVQDDNTNTALNQVSKRIYFPGEANNPNQQWLGFPSYDASSYQNGNATEALNHPQLFNPFVPQGDDLVFDVRQLEALLRYGATGSPALTSDLFKLCPLSLAVGRSRNLVTTHSFDLGYPGATPYLYSSATLTPSYQTTGTFPAAPYPTITFTGAAGTAVNYSSPPFTSASPTTLEFTADWQSLVGAQGLRIGTSTSGATLRKLDLNRVLQAYPAADATGVITDTATYNKALAARQQFAKDIFDRLCLVTNGTVFVPGTNFPAAATPQYNALHWLAQLAVNIVDYIDSDNYNTLWQWDGTNYVVGSELPRLVINEAYIEVGNKTNDPAGGGAGPALMPFHVRFWVELLNPMPDDGAGTYNESLQITTTATPPVTYPVYKLVASQFITGTSSFSNQDLGTPNTAGVLPLAPSAAPTTNPLIEVVNYTDKRSTQTPPIVPPVTVLPAGNKFQGPAVPPVANQNQGFYVLGPGSAFPCTTPATPPADLPQATLEVKKTVTAANPPMTYTTNSAMEYQIANTTPAANYTGVLHNLYLQRLACPFLPPNDPKLPTGPFAPYDNTKPYNPFITVDLLRRVPLNDAVTNDSTGQRVAAPPTANFRYSYGRRQPYAAHYNANAAGVSPSPSQIVQQSPDITAGDAIITPYADRPQQTLFRHNSSALPANFPDAALPAKLETLKYPFDWLVQLDRYLTSPIELMQVSAYPQHTLTQKFMGDYPNTRFQHLTPWTSNQAALLYRTFEFLEVGSRTNGVTTNGRIPGLFNINTLWDQSEVLQAVADPQTNLSRFAATDVATIFTNMIATRTPNGSPGQTIQETVAGVTGKDQPFRSLAVGQVPAADTQYPSGSSLADTVFRNNAAGTPLFQINTGGTATNGLDNPFLANELFNKIYNNITVRSNVFAVWLTVGFFEVDDSVTPPRLLSEIGRTEGRHIRHRMFAIVDRSNMAIPAKLTTLGAAVTAAGAQTVQVGALSGTTNLTGSSTTPGNYGNYNITMNWMIQPGTTLLIDQGTANEEAVTVTAVIPGPPASITANFAGTHAANATVSVYGAPGPTVTVGGVPTATVYGYPGPQPTNPATLSGFNPRYNTSVVPYFSIIQ